MLLSLLLFNCSLTSFSSKLPNCSSLIDCCIRSSTADFLELVVDSFLGINFQSLVSKFNDNFSLCEIAENVLTKLCATGVVTTEQTVGMVGATCSNLTFKLFLLSNIWRKLCCFSFSFFFISLGSKMSDFLALSSTNVSIERFGLSDGDLCTDLDDLLVFGVLDLDDDDVFGETNLLRSSRFFNGDLLIDA